MNIPRNIISSLTDKKKKLENVKTPKDLLDCAKEFRQELNQKQLEAVSGGSKEEWCLQDTGERKNPFNDLE